MGKACVVQDQSLDRTPVENGAMLPSRSATVTPSRAQPIYFLHRTEFPPAAVGEGRPW